MNTSATSNRSVRDIIVFLLGAGLAAIVLIVLYYTLPLGEADPTVVSEDDTSTIAESVEDSTQLPRQGSQSTGSYEGASLEEILNNYSRTFDRFAALYSLVSQSEEEQLVDLFNESLTYEYSESDDSWLPASIRRTILSRLVHVNDEVAGSLFHNLESEQQTTLAYTLARDWASIDLDRAIDFVSTLADNVQYSANRGILDLNQSLPIDELRTIANRLGDTNYVQNLVDRNFREEEAENPAEAWATLSADPNMLTQDNRSRINNIVNAWIKEEGVLVLDTVTEAIEDEDFKESITRYGLRIAAEDNPEAAFDYALQFDSGGGGLFGMSYNPYMYSILNEWAEDSPMDALNKVLTIDSTSQRNQYVENVFSSWVRHDVQGLVDVIPQLPSEIQDAARVSGISHLSRDSIDDALFLFDDIESDAKKGQAAMSIAFSWAEKDPEAALNWAQTNPNTESIRSQVTSTMLTSIATKDPEKAFNIALELPLNEDGVGLEASVLATLSYTNVDRALELLPKVRAGASQKTAYTGVGGGLAMQGRITEAIELGKELSEENQLNYYTTVGTMSLSGSMLSGLTGNEPEMDVFATLDAIPHEEARSQVAVQAIIMDQLSSSYSDEEIESLKEYVSEEDMEDLEEGLEQLESMPMPSIPFLGL
ncbi:MAG: hypothetical protein F4227_10470 [Gammaproteobacteria bacterium]|nr:hypothetical protein [Gammaproteobacteria bacterium]MYF03362.1 hypothetical protein [Gammaproteobacteria bacterium]MYI76746.1 hypothetical protein [Gammaproteobacteria bacterium]